MADAIVTRNPVKTTKFIINRRGDDIEGTRVNQETPRGRLGFRDTNGRFTLPRSAAEASKNTLALDWHKPLNPGPYFDGPGLNGEGPYAFNSGGTLDGSESTFAMDPDLAYQTPWPIGVKVYEIPPLFYDVPVVSGNRALAFKGGTFTYGSGNYVAPLSSYALGDPVYAAYTSGDEGKPTYAASGVSRVAGYVRAKEVFGVNTLTINLLHDG